MRAWSILPAALWLLAPAAAAGAGGNTPDAGPTPVINEFLASNGSRPPLGEGDLLDADRDSSDWIELYNPAAATFDLGGWFLTDDAGSPAKWQFPRPTLLAPGGYLVVFASGKDRATGELHTNFKLAAEGGYLALVRPDGRTAAHDYGARYPPQVRDVSYGLPPEPTADATPRYLAIPTPGRPNTSASLDLVAGPRFSQEHGFYEEAFPLALSCDTPGATIRYTTDGRPPTETTGQVYTAPFTIETTTCVRAAAFKTPWRPSPVTTRTYLFLGAVGRQPSRPPGVPAAWGTAPADYEMDPEIVDEITGQQLAETLRSLPTLSIVMDVDDLFGAAGIYTNWSRSGEDWERPCSVEWLGPDADQGFQVNCGIRIYGGAGRREAKKSFRLQFTGDSGPAELRYPLFGPGVADHFDQLVLRAGFNDAYAYVLGGARAQFLRDEFVRRLQLALGHPAPHGTFVHLYLNGLYWGLYNPVERPESSFAATYLGGDKRDWDALNSGWPVGAGTTDTWNAMLDLVRQGLMSNANYQRLQGNRPDGTRHPAYVPYLDLDNYIDYLLLNFFIGNRDWPMRNWYAALNRVAPTGWKAFSWDAEHSLGIDSPLTTDVTDVSDGIGEPYARLRANPEFCLRFADRVQRAFGPGGPLYVDTSHPDFDPGHPAGNRPAALYAALAEAVEPALAAESARWGDLKGTAPYRIDDWRSERDWLLHTYLSQRAGMVLDQLRRAGLSPALDPPAFQIDGVPEQGGPVPAEGVLTLTAAPGAAVYYTMDGSDPRTPPFRSGDCRPVTLVPADAPKRVLVPSAANGGDLLRNFSGGFEVACYQAPGAVDDLVAAEAVIATAGLRTSAATEQARVINYGVLDQSGHFDADQPLPGIATDANDNDLVILVTGRITVPAAGHWTLGVRSGGAFQLILSRRGKTLTCFQPDPRPPGDTLAVFDFADSGPQDLRLVCWGQDAGAELELFAAPGRFAAFSPADFRLVGDILSGSPPAEDAALWLSPSFVDAAWCSGTGGVGFERAGGYEGLFQIDVGAEMYGVNGSCYVRIPFTLPGASFAGLALQVRHSGGFIAYLNGVEVARRNFRGDPRWDSCADRIAASETVATSETIDLSAHAGLLRPGTNLLAVHGLNAALASPRFLISVELTADELGPGSVSPTAILYDGPASLRRSIRLQARAFDGAWSALNEAVFAVGPVAQGLRVSEIMYHPPDTGRPGDPNTEFLELTNVADRSIDLSLARFTQGVDYTFPAFELRPGGYCLLVRDRAAFEEKYGAHLPVVGQYTGALDNGGERIVLADAAGRIIESFRYRDNWFKSTDGQGFSLTVAEPAVSDANSLNDKSAWRPSTAPGGSPGTGDPG